MNRFLTPLTKSINSYFALVRNVSTGLALHMTSGFSIQLVSLLIVSEVFGTVFMRALDCLKILCAIDQKC